MLNGSCLLAIFQMSLSVHFDTRLYNRPVETPQQFFAILPGKLRIRTRLVQADDQLFVVHRVWPREAKQAFISFTFYDGIRERLGRGKGWALLVKRLLAANPQRDSYRRGALHRSSLGLHA